MKWSLSFFILGVDSCTFFYQDLDDVYQIEGSVIIAQVMKWGAAIFIFSIYFRSSLFQMLVHDIHQVVVFVIKAQGMW